MREVIVYEKVHNKLWQVLPEEAFETVRDKLIGQLEANCDRWRAHRYPEDETYFVYSLYFALGEVWHTFEFLVDDTTADTNLLVLAVNHRLGKIRLP